MYELLADGTTVSLLPKAVKGVYKVAAADAFVIKGVKYVPYAAPVPCP